jgi:NAD+ kinase
MGAMQYKKIAIIANNTAKAQNILKEINKYYNFLQLKDLSMKPEVDLLIILGGDGFMLHCLHQIIDFNIPIYGINCGTVGFLLNDYNLENLPERIKQSELTITHPLEMHAFSTVGEEISKLAINEVSVFRNSSQAAKIQVSIDGRIRLNELIADGILVSTPAGSSAYNYSVNGPILPIGSEILALTPISPFRPKKWSGAVLPSSAVITLDILDCNLRSVNVVADFLEFKDINSVTIFENRKKSIKLLFDHNHSLKERILREQFNT